MKRVWIDGRPRDERIEGASSLHGFTLVEMMVAFTILLLSVGAISVSFVQAIEAQRSSRETTRALDAAKSVLEDMKARPFATIFSLYNANPLDDPPGTVPGSSFAVPGLTPVPGDADGAAGEIRFPVDVLMQLREDVVDAQLGMPRDLNGDGAPPDALDHSADYLLLPVEVRVQWTGVSGTREISLFTTLANL